MAPKIHEYISGQIWLCAYPVKYLGMKFHARMTIIRLADGKLMLHSPCEVDDLMRPMLGEIGEVAYIVAPGTFHHMHVASAQAAFPEAKTFICPGLESKRPSMRFDFLLGDVAPAVWAGQFDQAVVRGNRWISEVAFFHRTTKTLILVDLVENYGDASTEVDWLLKLWWRFGTPHVEHAEAGAGISTWLERQENCTRIAAEHFALGFRARHHRAWRPH